MLNLENHPCFNEETRGKTGRIHLPVAPKCNVRCNFCNRKHDCLNESRPGVSSAVLTPAQALNWLREMVSNRPEIAVVGIAGPGDPFANVWETMETLRRVRKAFPEMLLCVATNGLEATPCIGELAELQVSHVTVTVNAVDPEIAGKVYGWIRPDKKPLRGIEAGKVMVERQRKVMQLIKEKNMILKVNTIVIPGVNDHHIFEVSRTVAELGADVHNCMPLVHVPGTPFGDLPEMSNTELERIRGISGEFLPQMTHCARCRADAVGKIGEEMSDETMCCLQRAASSGAEGRDRVAVASREGLLVNQHLGEAEKLWIFDKSGVAGDRAIEQRETPSKGTGLSRWENLAQSLHDCGALLCSGVGEKPIEILKKHDINVITVNGVIQEALDAYYNGRPLKAPVRKFACGAECAGDGTGCG